MILEIRQNPSAGTAIGRWGSRTAPSGARPMRWTPEPDHPPRPTPVGRPRRPERGDAYFEAFRQAEIFNLRTFGLKAAI